MWNVPRIWEGGSCWIIGGGWSLTRQFNVPQELMTELEKFQADLSEVSPYLKELHGKHILGVNRAYEIGDWVDVLFFGDKSFYLEHRIKMSEFPGLKATCCPKFANRRPDHTEGIKFVQQDKQKPQGISQKSGFISWNKNSGSASINLAYHLGAKRIFLLGFDMNKGPGGVTHWFGKHKPKVRPKPRPKTKLKDRPKARPRKRRRSLYERHTEGFPDIAKDAIRLGIEIFNVSDTSSVKEFPKITVEEALKC